MKISIAYSPDTDDAFMLEALASKLIDWQGFEFSFFRDDIQQLNEEAKSGRFDVTAISMATLPFISEQYELMEVGSSIGDQFGPALVVKHASNVKTPEELKDKKIAVPGLQTSAYMAAFLTIGGFEPVPMHFEKISEAVQSSQVDAGILIHELQICSEQHGLRKIADIGKLWFEKTSLPLPLGGNAIRKSLGADKIKALTQLMQDSIRYAFSNRDSVLKTAVESSVKGMTLDNEKANRYIDMYVNERSLNLHEDVKEALNHMYKNASEKGLCPYMQIS